MRDYERDHERATELKMSYEDYLDSHEKYEDDCVGVDNGNAEDVTRTCLCKIRDSRGRAFQHRKRDYIKLRAPHVPSPLLFHGDLRRDVCA